MLRAVFFDSKTYSNFIESCIRDYQNQELLRALGLEYSNRRPLQLASVKKHFIKKKYQAMVKEKLPILYQLQNRTGLMEEDLFLNMVFEEIERRRKRKHSKKIGYSIIPDKALLVSEEELQNHMIQKECISPVFVHDGRERNGKIYGLKTVKKLANLDKNQCYSYTF
ncbi:MAG: hypothetical protein C0169_00315 [Thermodesulfobacterium geofontis]|uniref:Uncharacterized protein n=1 Tax=Thermodesulfobacterium geofontis TaxID=1295609 RepID=A0A2N7QGS1_9BACT|nr:MAG: hypothetical protein C0169_00315 [Thermodesulfobacterium geofontis]